MSSTRTTDSATKARILRKLSAMAEINRSGVCQRIATARREAGITQEDMADMLDLSTRGYQAYEADRVPFRRLDQIAEITGVTKAWLLHGEDVPPASVDLLAEMREVKELLRELLEERRGGVDGEEASP